METLADVTNYRSSVLVVDDDLSLCKLMAQRLQQAGFAVQCAANGSEALACLTRAAVQLVLLDIVMPGMNGLELLYLIRSAHPAYELPVIIITSMDEQDEMIGAFELGANDYITKPLNMEVALARIQAQLKLSQPRSVTPTHSVGGGRYVIQSMLGSGGFSQTFLASDQHRPTQPRVVVKRLHLNLAEQAGYHMADYARRSFSQEAITLELLGHHPRIPRLLAHFEENGHYYLIEDYVAGMSLRQRLDTGWCLSPRHVIDFLQQVLTILAFVHSQGIIHRDIKPSNLIATERAGLMDYHLIDFGSIKSVQAGEQPTHFVGTPGYAPYEQYAGRPRLSSDLFALGCVAMELLLGKGPDLERRYEHLDAVRQQDSGLARILERLTYPDPEYRYAQAAAVLEALAALNLKTA